MKAENGLKKCSKCGEVKGVEEYHKYSKSKDKLWYSCKQCVNNSSHLYYIENKSSVAETKKIYVKNNIEKINARQRSSYKKNPSIKKNSSKKSVSTLVLSYVKKKIVREFGVSASDVTPKMIELKRTQLINKRLIKNLKENETE